MKIYKVTHSGGELRMIADSAREAAQKTAHKTKGRVVGVEDDRNRGWFFLIRGATAYPISARAAALEVGMGGSR